MRRPRFIPWVRRNMLSRAQTTSFSMRRLAALAQRDSGMGIAEPLLLFAHEADRADELMRYVYDRDLHVEYATVRRRLGARSVEEIVLRGTPLRSVPEAYRAVIQAYDEAYHAPERIAAEKRAAQGRAYAAMRENGLSPTQLAKALKLDPGNAHAFLEGADLSRFTLQTAESIARYLEEYVHGAR